MSNINNGVLDGTRRVEPGVRGLGVNGGIAGAWWYMLTSDLYYLPCWESLPG